ncbi:MAG: ribose 5-phosphate isomerase B [Bacteroidetes bacterium]|jgi:ribose 5-phosphate isomerase B|nr:ribose 5-phosphate isomerase B [Bacteroidota bacterium]
MKNLSIGSDHAGFALKEELKKSGILDDYTIVDFGTDSEESTDYPDFAHPTAKSVEEGESELGILICGSGNGVAMSANKHAGVRAALCWNPELASLARQHNNANILCLASRFIESDTALEIVKAFFSAEFEGGRHARRVKKI